MNFGNYLRAVRKKQKMSLRLLAQKVGVDHSYLSKIENNIKSPPSDEIVLRIANVLRISPEEFFIMVGKIPPGLSKLFRHPKMSGFLRAAKGLTSAEIDSLIEFSKLIKKVKKGK